MHLTQQAFDGLLAYLDADPERAGRTYERVRLKLLKFFEWHGSPCPEDLADEVIDRVCRRIEEGEQIRAAEPLSYFYGVARNILKEQRSGSQREFTARSSAVLDRQVDLDGGDSIGQEERRFRCLEHCLAALPPESRELIIRYYEGQRHKKIENRRSMAQNMGIPLNALRLRTQRLRSRLESCVRDCVDRAERDSSVDHILTKGSA